MTETLPIWITCLVAVIWGAAGVLIGDARGVWRTLRRLRAEGPDILVTMTDAGQPVRTARVARGQRCRITHAGGIVTVEFALTRPLPPEVAAMLDEVGR